MSGAVIEIKGLRKRYGRVEAVRGVDLTVPAGSICGFLGRNGAGKTTTIKMLMGITKPNGGEGRVFGHRIDVPADSVEIRKRVGFVSEDKELPPFLTVDQAIRITRGFYPCWREDLERRFLDAFELPRKRYVRLLSRGARTKVALLLALARGADLLILDEPTSGLDPAMIETALGALVSLAAESGTTIFFSSHQLAEVEQIADRVCILDEGRVVVSDSIDELKANYRRVRLVFAGEPAPVPSMAGVEGIQREGRTVSLLVNGNLQEVLGRVHALNPHAVDVQPVSFKEIFLECVGKGGRDAVA